MNKTSNLFNKWPHTGAIFCGGKSSRMGRPKAGVVIPSGLTMVEHVYLGLKNICKDIVLVGHGQGVPRSMDHLTRITDNIRDIGPMGALEALLSSGLDTEYLIVPCDLGASNDEVFELLVADLHLRPPVILTCEERSAHGYKLFDQPLIGRYSADLLPLVRGQIKKKDLALNSLLKTTKVTRIMVPQRLNSFVADLDCPHDMHKVFSTN